MDTIRLLEHPEQCPGGYALHLYCRYENPEHGYQEFPWEMSDWETYREAARAARECGWILHRDRTATCPKCAKALGLRSSPSSNGGE